MAGIAGHLVLFSVCVSCTEKVPRLIIIHSLWIGIDPRKITPSAIIAVLHTLHHANWSIWAGSCLCWCSMQNCRITQPSRGFWSHTWYWHQWQRPDEECQTTAVGRIASKHRHMELPLVFFSTFDSINIRPHSVKQRNGVPMLFDSASSSNKPSLYTCPVSTFESINIMPLSVKQRICVPMLYDSASSCNEPSLYIFPVCNILSRVPLIPCFIAGSMLATSTLLCQSACHWQSSGGSRRHPNTIVFFSLPFSHFSLHPFNPKQ